MKKQVKIYKTHDKVFSIKLYFLEDENIYIGVIIDSLNSIVDVCYAYNYEIVLENKCIFRIERIFDNEKI